MAIFDFSEYEDSFCRHGYRYDDCPECDAIEQENGGIDKCLNCGKYKWGKDLNSSQCCSKGCVNPNEY